MRTFAFACALTLFVPPAARGADKVAEDSVWDAKIVLVQGDVKVRLAKDKSVVPAKESFPLENEDTVTTGLKSKAQISLEGTTLFEMNPSSQFIIHSNRKKKTILGVPVGGFLAKVTGLVSDGIFKIKTPTAVAAVRGTELAIEISTDTDRTMVGVFDEGQLLVSTEESGEEGVMLGPNQETEVKTGERPLPASSLKYFAFHKKRMAVIRKRLSLIRKRWKSKLDRYRKLAPRKTKPAQ